MYLVGYELQRQLHNVKDKKGKMLVNSPAPTISKGR